MGDTAASACLSSPAHPDVSGTPRSECTSARPSRSAGLSTTSSFTLAVPARQTSRALAAATERSMTRPAMKGPRSLMRTIASRCVAQVRNPYQGIERKSAVGRCQCACFVRLAAGSLSPGGFGEHTSLQFQVVSMPQSRVAMGVACWPEACFTGTVGCGDRRRRSRNFGLSLFLPHPVGKIAMANKPRPASNLQRKPASPVNAAIRYNMAHCRIGFTAFAQSTSIIRGRPKWVNEVAPYLLPKAERW